MSREFSRPSGNQPPADTLFAGQVMALRPLAEATTVRHLAHCPSDVERYGAELAEEWCIHDMQWVLAWAFGDVAGYLELDSQVAWLDRILRSRDYPMDNFYSAIRDAADVVDELVPEGAPVAARLRAVGVGPAE